MYVHVCIYTLYTSYTLRVCVCMYTHMWMHTGFGYAVIQRMINKLVM